MQLNVQAAIEMVHLVKRFGEITAVDNLSLTVEPGEIFGLLGPNGSGKTTTVNLISGLAAPTSGQVRVMGFDMRTEATRVRQILGSVPQETALYEELSAWTNLDFHADLFGVPPREKRVRIERMLDLVGLTDRRESRVSAYSGGMKRRLALARALLHDPQLIYLYEPTLGVDIQSRRAIWDYILALRKQGKTVLITTNYLEEAQELCGRVAIIDHGRLVALDTPARLKRRFGGSVVEMETLRPFDDMERLRVLPGVAEIQQADRVLKVSTESGHNIVPQIINIVAQCCEIRDIVVREPNLDEVFLKLTGKALRD